MRPTTHITEAQTESPNKARVEAELKTLQDANRLAIHVWEDTLNPHLLRSFSTLLPDATLGNLDASQEHGSVQAMLNDKIFPLLSMSLLPNAASRRYITPYYNNCAIHPGYLINLSQNQLDAPRVFQVCARDIFSHDDPWNKRPLEIPPINCSHDSHPHYEEGTRLYDFYNQFASPSELSAAVASDKG